MLRAELFRFNRNAALPTLLIIAVGLNVLAVYGTVVQMGEVPDPGAVTDEARTLELVGLGFGASLFSMVFGALSVTRDFTSGVIGRARLLVGGSKNLFVSRATVVAPAMVIFGILGSASAILTAWATLPSIGASFAWDSEVAVVAAGTAFSILFAGYFGQFIAWQSRRSLITVIGLVAWTLLLETTLITLIPSVGRFLPGGLGQAMMRDTSATDLILSTGWGYAAYGVWLIALAALATLRLRRTDLL